MGVLFWIALASLTPQDRRQYYLGDEANMARRANNIQEAPSFTKRESNNPLDLLGAGPGSGLSKMISGIILDNVEQYLEPQELSVVEHFLNNDGIHILRKIMFGLGRRVLQVIQENAAEMEGDQGSLYRQAGQLRQALQDANEERLLKQVSLLSKLPPLRDAPLLREEQLRSQLRSQQQEQPQGRYDKWGGMDPGSLQDTLQRYRKLYKH